MSQTISEVAPVTTLDIFPYEDTDDPNHRTHIVNPPKNTHIWKPGMSMQDVVDIARATGQELVCLCGYILVPKANPDKYDACETCIRIAGELMAGAGE